MVLCIVVSVFKEGILVLPCGTVVELYVTYYLHCSQLVVKSIY